MAMTSPVRDGLFSLPPTVAGRWRRRRKWLYCIGGMLVLIIVWIGGPIIWPCTECVTRIDGEDIGVSAGGFPFNPGDHRFSAAEDRIQQLNQQVEESGRPYVNVALLTPLTWTATSELSRTKIIHQVEGAAVALDRVNNEAVTGRSPLIKLQLANEGIDEGHYGEVVQQLIGMRAGPHPLDAVIGLGVSKGATMTGAKELSKAGIPLIASNLTGDPLDSSDIPGLSRVSPSNSDDVAALATYLARRPEPPATMLVHAVQKDGDKADFYTSTLTEDFRRQMNRYKVAPDEPFDSKVLGNSFSVISTNLCTSKNPPNSVLYAGREPDLPLFIHDLAQRPCADMPITLVAGADSCALLSGANGPAQTKQISADMVAGKVTVLCPAWAAPQNWASGKHIGRPAGFSAFAKDFQDMFTMKQNFGAELDDGYAIMPHDALLTAAKAIRLSTTPSMSVPTPAQVLSNQFHMDAANTVPGASGTFTFVEENNGNPVGKPVFVLHIRSSGPPVLLFTYSG